MFALWMVWRSLLSIHARLTSKHQARYHRGQDRLSHAAPSSRELLARSAQLGNSLTSVPMLLVDMLGDYGAAELECAIAEALHKDVPHPNAVRQVLERRREQRNEPPPIAVHVRHINAKGISVKPASLAAYDQLGTLSGDEKPTNTNDKHDALTAQGEYP
jgi:hypothetical protein